MLDTVDVKAAGGETLPAAPVTHTTGIAILGSNPATVGLAPFGDPSWRILACSPDNSPYGNGKNAKALPRFDEWFEVHIPIEDPTRPFGYVKWASELPLVWLRDEKALRHFKGGRLYPERQLKGTATAQKIKVPTGTFRQVQDENGKVGFAEIMEERITIVPNHDGMFDPCQFTSSIAHMLAKAIVDCEKEGIKQIGLWGIMQQTENEWTYQRPGIQYFLHQAMQRGIKVIANRESCLFDMPQWKW